MSGTIGILTLELSRYAAFHEAAMSVQKPKGTKILFSSGKAYGVTLETDISGSPVRDIIDKQNFLASHMHGDWLWLLGDDHTFGEDALLSLLKHFDRKDIDIVCPVNISRKKPFSPLIFDEDGKALGWEVLDGKHGLVEVPACGNAGMLIRRRVFDKIPYPWFSWGARDCPYQGSDLTFCWKARQAGFKVWIDTETVFGHIPMATLIPARLGPDGAYGAYLQIQGEMVAYFRFRGTETGAVVFEQKTLPAILEEAAHDRIS